MKFDLSYSSNAFYTGFYSALLILMSALPFSKTYAQASPCGTDVPPGLLVQYIREVPAINEFARNRTSSFSYTIPVRFTNFDGDALTFIFDSAFISFRLSSLSQALGSGWNFIPCGNPSNLRDDRLFREVDGDKILSAFSYTSGTMEVYYNDPVNPDLPSHAGIPITAYQENNPNITSQYLHDNFISIRHPSQLGTLSTFIHEAGHHFGLLHTFHNAIENYQYPAIDSTRNDYPELPADVNQVSPNWWPRELVIRTQNINKLHPNPNYSFAGDLVEDTPVDCNTNQNTLGQNATYPQFPGPPSTSLAGCPITAQLADCSFNANALTYKDYNGDAIYPAAVGSLGNNYMSYWKSTCTTMFTDSQKVRAAYYYETYRSPVYTPGACGNFIDKVEFEGTNIGLHNVTIRTRHPSDNRICNVTTDKNGNYSGLLFSDDLFAYTFHNGKKNLLLHQNDPLLMHFDHTPCEWLRGLSTFDLLLIQRHILNIEPLPTGYSIIAADANGSNSVTGFDVVLLRKLILGLISKLPDFEQPWRYIPEFIPQDNSTSFNSNPFSLTLNGQNIGASYLQPTWQFSFPGSLNGKKGFDGIKIGDVNGSYPQGQECPSEGSLPEDGPKPDFTVPNTAIAQNDTVILNIKASGFENVAAFQLGMKIPFQKLEVIKIENPTTQLASFSVDDNFGVNQIEQDEFKLLWFNPSIQNTTLQNNTILFSLMVKAKTAIASLETAIELKNSILQNSFWDKNGNSLNTALEITVEELPDQRTLVPGSSSEQNTFYVWPNPFGETLKVSFENPSKNQTIGSLQVRNSSGNLLQDKKVNISSGENLYEIHLENAVSKGQYLITLNVEGKVYAAKAIKE